MTCTWSMISLLVQSSVQQNQNNVQLDFDGFGWLCYCVIPCKLQWQIRQWVSCEWILECCQFSKPVGCTSLIQSSPFHNQGEEDEFSHTDTPPTGRRTAGKDGAASAIASLISEDSKDDTHSEGEESDGTDKPSESDDLSASAGTLQSPYFLESLPNSPASVSHRSVSVTAVTVWVLFVQRRTQMWSLYWIRIYFTRPDSKRV